MRGKIDDTKLDQEIPYRSNSLSALWRQERVRPRNRSSRLLVLLPRRGMATTARLSNAKPLRCLSMSPLFDESKGSRPGIGTNGTSAQAILLGSYQRAPVEREARVGSRVRSWLHIWRARRTNLRRGSVFPAIALYQSLQDVTLQVQD